ncbi:MAG TPA: uracil-DNA glycosylase [Bacillota bacterium]|nr:uracil-DNA glycosylase [Bacillota bacterium]HPT67177.1 uracil-DNA glycosylase [Bacillota bacterium]
MEQEMILAELAALKAKVVNCRACGLRAGCQQVVFGEGYPGLMVIGEGPGADEDRLGRPFVGKAGQLLDKILASGGFDRHRNAYIANVVKCRPPGNRVPTPTECLACLPYLREQMYILQPKVVLLLGATALRGVLGVTEGITKARGNWIEQDGVWYLPTFHPAALLRDPRRKVEVWADIQSLFWKYRELVDPQHTSPFIPA